MALAVFNQFPQLTRFFAQLASAVARSEAQYAFNRLDLSTGAATLVDHAARTSRLHRWPQKLPDNGLSPKQRDLRLGKKGDVALDAVDDASGARVEMRTDVASPFTHSRGTSVIRSARDSCAHAVRGVLVSHEHYGLGACFYKLKKLFLDNPLRPLRSLR